MIKKFSFLTKRHVLLSIWIFIAFISASTFQAREQEKWIPDYDHRDEWQQPEKILDAIGIQPGMIVADV